MVIKKKIHPEYFDAIQSGKKTYELRLADWNCTEGDILVLQEWNPKTKKYTGREIKKTVTYIRKFKIDKLFWPKEDIEKYGLQVISIK